MSAEREGLRVENIMGQADGDPRLAVAILVTEIAQEAHDAAPDAGPGPMYIPSDFMDMYDRILALLREGGEPVAEKITDWGAIQWWWPNGSDHLPIGTKLYAEPVQAQEPVGWMVVSHLDGKLYSTWFVQPRATREEAEEDRREIMERYTDDPFTYTVEPVGASPVASAPEPKEGWEAFFASWLFNVHDPSASVKESAKSLAAWVRRRFPGASAPEEDREAYGIPGHCYDINGDEWHAPGECKAPECRKRPCCGYRATQREGGETDG